MKTFLFLSISFIFLATANLAFAQTTLSVPGTFYEHSATSLTIKNDSGTAIKAISTAGFPSIFGESRCTGTNCNAITARLTGSGQGSSIYSTVSGTYQSSIYTLATGTSSSALWSQATNQGYSAFFKGGKGVAIVGSGVGSPNTPNPATGIGLQIGDRSRPDGYRLSVDGKIIAEEILVETSDEWPDYVFNTSYDLKTLEEIEAFIQENGHLPNFEPASEIDGRGIFLGKSQVNTVKTLEELTLHLIKLNQTNKELISINEDLLKRIETLEAKING